MALLVASAPAVADVSYVVKGVDDELTENVLSHVDTIQFGPQVRQSSRDMEKVLGNAVTNAHSALRPYGYYAPEIIAQVISRTGTEPIVEIDITVGPPIRITNVELRVEGPGAEKQQFKEWRKGWPLTGLEFSLRGDNLTVLNVPDVQAVADADINISFSGDSLDLNGRIDIARARITPANINMSRVSESEDVVVVNGTLPDEDLAEDYVGDLLYTGEMVVTLGSDVVIDLDLAQASLGGSTTFKWTGEPLPIANGRYDLDGEILAFGQKLEIVEGSLRFDNVPANDPYIRVRAEREIYGNTQVRRAGILVEGTIRNPTIDAYTNPQTTEERALTLLVTGSDFDYERGIGAIDFGTYIAPKIYASYGIGLFDNENVVRIRYDLARGFGVTATSGQKESGVDIAYRFEN